MISKSTSLILLASAAVLLLLVGSSIPPFPQPQTYHHFADQRSLLGISNFWNVLSNTLFAIAGLWGMFLLLTPGKVQFADPRERKPWIGVSLGLILTAIGSAYYHLSPDNNSLEWDRLPMTIVFMSFIAALISERINATLGLLLWPPLLIFGLFTVLHWEATEKLGMGDLRFYFGLQGFTFLTTIIMLLTPSPYTRAGDLAMIALFYGLAVFFEAFDQRIFTLTGNIVSGHTLKHLSAAMGGLWMIRMIGKRRIAQSKNTTHEINSKGEQR